MEIFYFDIISFNIIAKPPSFEEHKIEGFQKRDVSFWNVCRKYAFYSNLAMAQTKPPLQNLPFSKNEVMESAAPQNW